MKNRIWLRTVLLAAILAAVIYALRVGHVSGFGSAAFRTLLLASFSIALAAVGFAVCPHARNLLGVLLVSLGALIVILATLVELTMGQAGLVALELEKPVELGFANVVLNGFSASYADRGSLLGSESTLLVDVKGKTEILKVASGRPAKIHGTSIFQLGFGRDEGPGEHRLYSRLGFLKEKAGLPFRAGLGLLDIGVLLILFFDRSRGSRTSEP